MTHSPHADVKPFELPRVQVTEHAGNVLLQTDLVRGDTRGGYAYFQVFAYGDAIEAAGVGAFLDGKQLTVNFDKHYPHPTRTLQVH
jgi:hypothetical protein